MGNDGIQALINNVHGSTHTYREHHRHEQHASLIRCVGQCHCLDKLTLRRLQCRMACAAVEAWLEPVKIQHHADRSWLTSCGASDQTVSGPFPTNKAETC